MNKFKATVTTEFRTRKVCVQIGCNNSEGQLDLNQPHWIIPFDNEEHAWAVADAYNYPEHNVNDWREAMLTE